MSAPHWAAGPGAPQMLTSRLPGRARSVPSGTGLRAFLAGEACSSISDASACEPAQAGAFGPAQDEQPDGGHEVGEVPGAGIRAVGGLTAQLLADPGLEAEQAVKVIWGQAVAGGGGIVEASCAGRFMASPLAFPGGAVWVPALVGMQPGSIRAGDQRCPAVPAAVERAAAGQAGVLEQPAVGGAGEDDGQVPAQLPRAAEGPVGPASVLGQALGAVPAGEAHCPRVGVGTRDAATASAGGQRGVGAAVTAECQACDLAAGQAGDCGEPAGDAGGKPDQLVDLDLAVGDAPGEPAQLRDPGWRQVEPEGQAQQVSGQGFAG